MLPPRPATAALRATGKRFVARLDNGGWSLYGARWLQPVAISRKSDHRDARAHEPGERTPARRRATRRWRRCGAGHRGRATALCSRRAGRVSSGDAQSCGSRSSPQGRSETESRSLRAEAVERFERLRLQRNRAGTQSRLRVLEPPVRVRAPHVDDPGLAVDVAPLEPEKLRGSQPCRRGKHDHRPVHPAQPRSDGLDLIPRLEWPLLPRPPRRVTDPALGRIGIDQPPVDRPVQHAAAPASPQTDALPGPSAATRTRPSARDPRAASHRARASPC
jgi:hypothetical protein